MYSVAILRCLLAPDVEGHNVVLSKNVSMVRLWKRNTYIRWNDLAPVSVDRGDQFCTRGIVPERGLHAKTLKVRGDNVGVRSRDFLPVRIMRTSSHAGQRLVLISRSTTIPIGIVAAIGKEPDTPTDISTMLSEQQDRHTTYHLGLPLGWPEKEQRESG